MNIGIHLVTSSRRRKLILNFLKKASQTKKAKPRKSNSQQTKLSSTEETNKKKGSATQAKRKQKVVKDTFKSQFEDRILKALKFYQSLLEDYKNKEFVPKDESRNEEQKLEYQVRSEKKSTRNTAKFLSSSQVADAMARCSKMPEEKQELMVKDVEMNMDLADFNLESEWTIEMTEEAHKWFRKHRKRQNDFCERVIRRLKILGTGRWPYVLCKPLKTKNSSARLYESKIDSGSRIIWEVATSFSPRRSSPGNPFWEQYVNCCLKSLIPSLD
jgi:HD-GYP domain-containing protein (c-di-GMP phosphodiesterase class II)